MTDDIPAAKVEAVALAIAKCEMPHTIEVPCRDHSAMLALALAAIRAADAWDAANLKPIRFSVSGVVDAPQWWAD